MASEKTRNSCDHAGGVDALTFKLLHDVQKVVVYLGLVAKFVFDLIEIGEGVFNFESLEIWIVCVVCVGITDAVIRRARGSRRSKS